MQRFTIDVISEKDTGRLRVEAQCDSPNNDSTLIEEAVILKIKNHVTDLLNTIPHGHMVTGTDIDKCRAEASMAADIMDAGDPIQFTDDSQSAESKSDDRAGN